ncbi:recombinase family protein [Candidatus Uabimicrobium sp. HlEnr_7]|uniref:recombinase family protein n=1 Tax=Candidatus Uabimicrobium helgolandensis TaxID=3095367 RepID=UPI0035590907
MKKKLGLELEQEITVCYSRVSANDQKKDLERQRQELKNYCEQQKYTNVLEIKETGT